MPPPTTSRSKRWRPSSSEPTVVKSPRMGGLSYSKSRMSAATAADVRTYWDSHIHDLAVSTHAPGSPGFFADLDAYHFEKLHHLLRLVDFAAWRDRDVLDVGCGAGVEVVRFAQAGARITGVDASPKAVALASENVRQHRLTARLDV